MILLANIIFLHQFPDVYCRMGLPIQLTIFINAASYAALASGITSFFMDLDWTSIDPNQKQPDPLICGIFPRDTERWQAVQDFETKYEKRVRNIKVVSNLPNVDDYLSSFRKSLVNTGFNLFDPFEGLKIPQQLESKINLTNRSYFSTTVGLAFRKLDVFGYYKFVTAVKLRPFLERRMPRTSTAWKGICSKS